MINFKQLFCSHIYKDNTEEFLGKERTHDGYPSISYSNFHIYAIHRECIKCGKKHIKTKRYLII